MIQVTVSSDQLREAVALVLKEQSVGLLDAEIKKLTPVFAGPNNMPALGDFLELQVFLEPKDPPAPAPIERVTATGQRMRLATDQGRHVA